MAVGALEMRLFDCSKKVFSDPNKQPPPAHRNTTSPAYKESLNLHRSQKARMAGTRSAQKTAPPATAAELSRNHVPLNTGASPYSAESACAGRERRGGD